MPELPEVETIARQLNQVLPGRVIQSVEVLREKCFSGAGERLSGLAIKRVGRKAKMIVIEMQEARGKRQDLILLIHLKMTGQLIFDEKAQISNDKLQIKSNTQSLKRREGRVFGGHPTEDWVNSLPSKHTRVIVRYSDGSILYFNDMRVFGWMRTVDSGQWTVDSKKYPPDVIDSEYTVEYLRTVLKKSKRPVKLVLLDQDKIGGLGNIYVNDALYLAHTKPTRKADTLKNAEIALLHKTTRRVIERGIETGGASESTYKHINGMGGKYQEEYLIYKREGERCGLKGCEGVIKKIKLGGRGTYYCPVCQH